MQCAPSKRDESMTMYNTNRETSAPIDEDGDEFIIGIFDIKIGDLDYFPSIFDADSWSFPMPYEFNDQLIQYYLNVFLSFFFVMYIKLAFVSLYQGAACVAW